MYNGIVVDVSSGKIPSRRPNRLHVTKRRLLRAANLRSLYHGYHWYIRYLEIWDFHKSRKNTVVRGGLKHKKIRDYITNSNRSVCYSIRINRFAVHETVCKRTFRRTDFAFVAERTLLWHGPSGYFIRLLQVWNRSISYEKRLFARHWITVRGTVLDRNSARAYLT